MNNVIKIQPLGFPWHTEDPFLFCAYHKDDYPAGNKHFGPDTSLAGRNIGQDFTIKDGWRMYHGEKVPGFPFHPHRGFETITIVKQGIVDHTDSLGAAGRFSAGDVQWMTAGKGIQHSEMFPLLHQDKDNPLELFQVWLNLPRSHKLVEPHFKMLWEETIPVINVASDDNGTVTVKVIAGQAYGKTAPSPPPDSWAANKDHEVLILSAELSPGARWDIPPANQQVNRTLYFYSGDTLRIQETQVSKEHSILLQSDQPVTVKAGKEECHLLLLQGKPIGEPVVQYGPFVMNTEAEIRQTILEYQRNQFGGWPWPEREQVHDQNKGRFALHADGKEEVK